MNDFFKKNKQKLIANFDREVLEPLGNRVGLSDDATVRTMFASYVDDEEKYNIEAYESFDTEPVFTVKTPEVDLSTIRAETDGSLIASNLAAPKLYVPPRGEVPVDSPKLEWDYKPPFTGNVESETFKIVRGTPEDRRNQSYIAKRIRHPDVASHFDDITKSIPNFNHNDLGQVLTNDQKRLQDYYMDIWPRPDAIDGISLLKIK